MKNTNKYVIVIAIAFAFLFSIYSKDFFVRLIRKALINKSYDHMLGCNNLPNKSDVESVWKNHKTDFYETLGIKQGNTELVEGRITQPYGGHPDITNLHCKETDDLVFILQSIKQKEIIRKEYPGLFYGVPYRIKVY